MQKLHLLADIGFSFVTSINHSGISSSHPPGNILLPSSLYRVGRGNKNDEASFQDDLKSYYSACNRLDDVLIYLWVQVNSRSLMKSCLDEGCFKRVIHIFKSHISLVCYYSALFWFNYMTMIIMLMTCFLMFLFWWTFTFSPIA